MKIRRAFLLALALLVGSLVGCAGSGARVPADITIGEQGCTTASFTLPATREPSIVVQNDAAQAMVLTLPRMNRWVAVAPGRQARFELPRYIMGRFDFFCLSESQHTLLAGGNPYVCALEPAEIAPLARSAGIFEIAPHNRIRELGGTPRP